jgi:hypothetical protein
MEPPEPRPRHPGGSRPDAPAKAGDGGPDTAWPPDPTPITPFPPDPRGCPDFADLYAARYPALLARFEADVAAIAAEDPGRVPAHTRDCRPLPPGLPPECYPPWCLRGRGLVRLPLYRAVRPREGSPA